MCASEIQLYLDRARQDLLAAQINVEQGLYRVAVTRAYYAMFYATSALLASQSISRSKHSGVLAAFGEHFVKAGLIEPQYAKMLGYAFDSRLDADYDVTFTTDQGLAEELIRDARCFVERIVQYLSQAGMQ